MAQGRDIPHFDELVYVWRECCPEVTFYIISSEEIRHFSSIINGTPLLTFKGTMKVHQVVTAATKVWLRSLSCFSFKDFCNHYELGSLSYSGTSSKPDNSDKKVSYIKPLLQPYSLTSFSTKTVLTRQSRVYLQQ